MKIRNLVTCLPLNSNPLAWKDGATPRMRVSIQNTKPDHIYLFYFFLMARISLFQVLTLWSVIVKAHKNILPF